MNRDGPETSEHVGDCNLTSEVDLQNVRVFNFNIKFCLINNL